MTTPAQPEPIGQFKCGPLPEQRRPTIAELEEILKNNANYAVRVQPNGEVRAVEINPDERDVIGEAQKKMAECRLVGEHSGGYHAVAEMLMEHSHHLECKVSAVERERDEARKEAKAFEEILSDIGVKGGYPDADSWEDYPNNARLIKEAREHEEKRADALQKRIDGAVKAKIVYVVDDEVTKDCFGEIEMPYKDEVCPLKKGMQVFLIHADELASEK